jgi:hypothetical protein
VPRPEVAVLEIVDRAAQADLDGAAAIEKPLLDGTSKRRSVGQLEAAEIAVPKVGMGIEMHHADGALPAQRPKDRKRAQMVAARRQRLDATLDDLVEKPADAGERIVKVGRVHRSIAEIGDIGEIIGTCAGYVVDPAHHRRHLADLAGPVPRARAVGRAAVPRHADDPDVDVRAPPRSLSAAGA